MSKLFFITIDFFCLRLNDKISSFFEAFEKKIFELICHTQFYDKNHDIIENFDDDSDHNT